MTTDTRTTHRLPPRPGQIINPNETFTFTFDGKTYQAHPGDTIASALTANGVQLISRSFKYHRPRGLLCCAGYCPNCLVQIGNEPNVRACTRPVEPDMEVKPQNVWPSLERDVMSLTALGDRFLPVGFYYKTFIHPQALWPTYETFLRNAAGLGEIDIESQPEEAFDKQYLHGDVVVVGGGPAGLSAAISSAKQGAKVLLFDDNPQLGGHGRIRNYELGIRNRPHVMIGEIEQAEHITAYCKTTVIGWWDDHWLAAVQGTRLYKIRAKSVVIATGAYEQPRLFDNNDLPGVMLGSAVQKLVNLYGAIPGRSAVIVTANNDGWEVARSLQNAGVTVTAIVDERQNSPKPLAGVPLFKRHTIVSAEGKKQVKSAKIAPIDGEGNVTTKQTVSLACDLIAVSVGWSPANGLLYLANAKPAYNHDRFEFLPGEWGDGVYPAGRVAGTHDLELQLKEGELIGQQAAAYAGFGKQPSSENFAELEREKANEPPRTSPIVQVPGKGKQFLCYCEDVTDKDLEVAVAEGYNSIELLKRYSTISMGPCQGKMCSVNTIHLCAKANGWTIEETGTTTARPPMTPVKMGSLGGQVMEPVRYTPLHQWHIAQGAKMMVTGLWMRAEHYGDPAGEVKAVRERVGLIDISTLGKMRLTGKGVPDFLNKIYVNKWKGLRPDRVRYGVMCNDEGIVLDDGVTARVRQNEWYMTTTSSGAERMYEWMQWWLQSGWGDGIHLINVTDNYAAFNLAGAQSRAVLQTLTDVDLSNKALPYMRTIDMELAGVPVRLLRIGFTGELSYEIHVPAGYGHYLWTTIMEAGQPFGIVPFGVEAQRILRLEKAHIIVGQDTDALSDPISADMAWAVKLDKQDFLGKRAMSRISQEGIKQKLVGFKMIDDFVPEEGLQIVKTGTTEIIGWVTSSRHSPTLNEAIGLCWLPVEMADEPGTTFTIWRSGETLQARVFHGAFVDPAGMRLTS